MTTYKNQFGLGGQSDLDYDFFVGKRKRKKRKAKKAKRRLLKAEAQAPAARTVVRPAAPVARPASVASASVQSPAPVATPSIAEVPGETRMPQVGEAEVVQSEVPEEAEVQSDSEDSFLGFGKKARARRKLKLAEKATGVERMKAETTTIKSITAPFQTSAPAQAGAPASMDTEQASTAQTENMPEKSKSNMTLILAIAGGVVVVTIGLVIMLKKPAHVPMAI